MSPWEKLLEQPHSRGHFVQLYETDEASLGTNVGRYLWEGLRRGDGVVVVVAPDHRELFSSRLNQLGADVSALVEARQLVFCDARHMLAQFMDGGQPDWHRFEKAIRKAMREVRPRDSAGGVRAYGEMVGLLWKDRQFAAAIRLEQLWNRLLEQCSFSLYCAYEVDIFGQEFDVDNLERVLCTHTHLMPAQTDGRLDMALNRSMDEILGAKADALRMEIKANPHPGGAVMPSAERMVLWLRKNLPEPGG